MVLTQRAGLHSHLGSAYVAYVAPVPSTTFIMTYMSPRGFPTLDEPLPRVGGGPGFTRVIVCISIDLTCEQKLILSILLYGCESWCLTEELLHRLRVFHAQCLRAMSREGHAGKHTWEQHISSEQLMQELGLDAIDFYVARRQLRWLGHVSRMDWEASAYRGVCCLRGRHTRGRWARRGLPTAAAWPRRWTSSTSTTRAGRSSRLIGRGGGRCCRAARHRRLSNSRPRPRCPCPYPRPPRAPPACCGGAH